MRAIENINLDELTADQLDQVIGDHFDIPGHEPLFIEMTLLHWYWLNDRNKRGQTTDDYIQELLDDCSDEEIEYEPEFFAELFRRCLISGGQGTIQSEQEGIPINPPAH